MRPQKFLVVGKREICQLTSAGSLRKTIFDTFLLLYPTLIARAELTVAYADPMLVGLIYSYGRNLI